MPSVFRKTRKALDHHKAGGQKVSCLTAWFCAGVQVHYHRGDVRSSLVSTDVFVSLSLCRPKCLPMQTCPTVSVDLCDYIYASTLHSFY